MAMKKGLKIGLSVLTIGLTGTLVYMMIKKRNKKKLLSEAGGNLTPQDKQQVISNPVNATDNPPTTTQIDAVVSTGNTPFKNRTEGNAFRAWINDTYPDYATEIDLDRTGSYNNSYIKTAWAKYGTQYTQTAAPTEVKAAVATQVNEASILGNILAGGTTIANVLSGTTGIGVPNNPDDAKANAEALRDSMQGFATDETLFWAITNNLNSNQRKAVRDYFDNYLGEGENLGDWIAGDFSFGDEDRALDAWGYTCGYFGSCSKNIFLG